MKPLIDIAVDAGGTKTYTVQKPINSYEQVVYSEAEFSERKKTLKNLIRGCQNNIEIYQTELDVLNSI